MSAVATPPDTSLLSDEDLAAAGRIAEGLALFRIAQQMTEVHLRRLARLEDGLVRLLDRRDETRETVLRGQRIQLDALRLLARARSAR